MKKTVFLLALILQFHTISAQESTEKSSEKSAWTKGGTFTFLINQSTFENWVAGGVSNISVGKMNAGGGLQAGNNIGEFGNINSIGEETLLVKGSIVSEWSPSLIEVTPFLNWSQRFHLPP